ncbi:hypothetical protein ACJIZ3_012312 [Penstemon smallii]|uniref:G domain-containing protein n=1 Tax=Penstemon smallii TaxID=265156 RepID=A0ABD3UM02_9LAMI
MGGESLFASISTTEQVPSHGKDSPVQFCFSSDDDECLSTKLENDLVINGFNFEEFPGLDPRISSIFEAKERQKCKVYAQVLKSYDDLRSRIEMLKEAKNKLLSYTPGSWIERTDYITRHEYDVPRTTSLLLVGPKGSGKSSLVNKISRVLEDGKFTSEPAQVSYNQSIGDGTYFVHQYMVPKYSDSFCLYDTRSLSTDLRENLKMLKPWMRKGIRDGELVKRKSDSLNLKERLKCKARRSRLSCQDRPAMPINFVIFVVNGLSVLESIADDNNMKNRNSQLMSTIFNQPLLSFKDDKPVVVVTHGDLLTLSDRVKIRVYLGELLGVSPTRQIFDIPESNDSATTLTIVEMLTYCLEHADRNLPAKVKEKTINSILPFLLIVILVAMMFAFRKSQISQPRPLATTSSTSTSSSGIHVDWHKIRHLW